MNLPPALVRWAEPLAVLDPVLASALGPLLIRLAAAFGPLGGQIRKGGDEPDGYAGITRRGKLEHLLTTEWGLLDTAPDEFLRRLSQGELSFLEPERTAQAQERRCLILFDSGPEQLGAPRIAQLAAWIVFASTHLDPNLSETEAVERKKQEEDAKNKVRRRYEWASKMSM